MRAARRAQRSRQPRLRRARSVTMHWREGRLAFENYLTRQTITAEPIVVEVLSFFDRWRSPVDLIRRLSQFSPASVRRTLSTLVRHTLLVREGSPDARRDDTLAR